MDQQHSTTSQHYSPKIIINADDYGYSWERCKGIIELIESQCISSVSVLINAPEIQQKCSMLKQLIKGKCEKKEKQSNSNQIGKESGKIEEEKWIGEESLGISIGLHLNLTQFEPSSQGQYQQVLIVDQKTKIFKGKPFIFDNLSMFNSNTQLSLFLKSEIRSQIQKFIKIFKRKPSHIDGHNHIHVIPQIAEIICQVSRLFGIYKVRMPIPYKIVETANPTVNTFNNKLINLSYKAKTIYNKYGFIHPTFMLGLDTMGYDFTSENIKIKLQQLMMSIPQCQIPNIFIEIMIHPGYKQEEHFKQYPTCPFSQSAQRQHQLRILKSEQFAKIVNRNKLHSYLDLKNNYNSQQSVLIYSKLVLGSGNLTTSLRLAKILQQVLSAKIYLIDQPTIEQENQLERIRQLIQHFTIKLVIGVNLTRTAQVIYQATANINQSKNRFCYKVPYILIVTGTDANYTLNSQNNDITKLQQINKSIQNCQCIVSISQQMKNTVQKYISKMKIQKDIVVIPQSTVNLNQHNQKIMTQKSTKNSQQTKQQYIIFPTSFRKVKSIAHILPQLNTLIQKYKIKVYIVGPIIDQQYYNQVNQHLKKVEYLGCFSHQNYLNMLRGALMMINTSQTEGMSCSILEAFAESVPVIARKNTGNSQLLGDGKYGYLYQTGQQFIQKFQILYFNEKITDRICEKAYQLLIQKFSYEKQINQYQQMMNNYYKPMVSHLDISLTIPNISTQPQNNSSSSITIPKAILLSIRNVHPISPTNLKIFSKFFQKDGIGNRAVDYYAKQIIQSNSGNEVIHILDMCCGNGIFGISFMFYLIMWMNDNIDKLVRIKVSFADFDQISLCNLKINLKALKQFACSEFNRYIVIQSITIIKSDMFEQIMWNKFDIILGNPPQFPFSNPQTRFDKNGGQCGYRLMNILLTNYQKYLKNQQSFLMILYSYIGDPNKFNQFLENSNSSLTWKGQKQIHIVKKSQLQQIEKGITTKVQLMMKQERNQVTISQQHFYIPAELRIICPK